MDSSDKERNKDSILRFLSKYKLLGCAVNYFKGLLSLTYVSLATILMSGCFLL